MNQPSTSPPQPPTHERDRLLRALASGAVVCPACGYDLSGNRTAQCPECGRRITLQDVRPASGSLPTPVARRFARSAMFVAMVLVILFTVDSMRWLGGVARSAFMPPGRRALAALACAVVALVCSAVFLRQTRRRRHAWLLVAWLALLASLAVYWTPG